MMRDSNEANRYRLATDGPDRLVGRDFPAQIRPLHAQMYIAFPSVPLFRSTEDINKGRGQGNAVATEKQNEPPVLRARQRPAVQNTDWTT